MEFNQLTAENYNEIFENTEGSEAAAAFPFYPLDAPDMPPPGKSFTAHATQLAGPEASQAAINNWLQILYLQALYSPEFYLPIEIFGEMQALRCVPGHLYGYPNHGPFIPREEDYDGPRVMIVGKMPGHEELRHGRNWMGDSGTELLQRLNEVGVDEFEFQHWYTCNVVHWNDPRPSGALKTAWIKDCLPILHQELRLFKPDFIMCFGAEATKALLDTSVQRMIGRVEELVIPLHDSGEVPEYHVAKVMATVHPAAVVRNPDSRPALKTGIENFVKLTRQEQFSVSAEDFELVNLYTERELSNLVDGILAQPGLKKIAVDAEWHGNHPGDPGSYLRTIQISHREKFGATVVLRVEGGEHAFRPSERLAIHHLKRLLDRDDVQIIGHFFSADMPWLTHYGLDLRHRFVVPENVDDIRGGEYAGGWDTGLAAHANNETGDFKLEMQAIRHLGAHRWDHELKSWLKRWAAEHDLKMEEIEGFGDCPDNILLPYAGYDVAYTWLLHQLQAKESGFLDSDVYGNDCWVPFHISMLAFPAFNEMGTVGIKVDRERVDDLTDIFRGVRDQRLDEMREAISWPEFNPRSPQQCVEFLFGEAYSTKKDNNGHRLSVRPQGALTLRLDPIKATGAGSKPWDQIRARGEEHKYTPCTDKEVCGMLGAQSEYALMLRDLRIVDQVLKSVFRPPKVWEKPKRGQEAHGHTPGELMRGPAGRRIYPGGIGYYICNDDRVRSTFSQVKETGRASSARPALQNISKQRERDYKRILGDNYAYKIRSFIISNTDQEYQTRFVKEPTVLIEADYGGAELLVVATQARSETMIDHCLRSLLPEDDPNHYDIHSNIACLSFQLDCEPTKSGLASIGKSEMRVPAKNVIFGVNYGRTAEAIVRQCLEEGIQVTLQEVQGIIDSIFEIYPEVLVLQAALRQRVHSPGWLRNCFGRLRRFQRTSDRQAMGEAERQALNFPAQSAVADSVSYALHHLHNHKQRAELGYRIVLQIHDAVVLEVPTRSIDAVYREALPECMVDKVSFKACDLDGNPYTDSEEYRFGIDREVMARWGDALTWSECDELGIAREYGMEPEPVVA